MPKNLKQRLGGESNSETLPECEVRRQGGYLVKGRGKEEGVISRWLDIGEIQVDTDSNEIRLVVEFEYGGRTVNCTLSRSRLTRSGIFDLVKYGADVTDDNYGDVLRFLRSREAEITPKCVHNQLGWGEIGGLRVFRHHRGIGFESQYAGDYSLAPRGTLSEWMNVVKSDVCGNPMLELAVAIGFTSALVDPIANQTQLDALFIHAYGESSKGKTTAAQVATSVWGYPDTRDGGLILTWNATENALLAALRHNFGITVAFDEASMNHGDFTRMIYQVVQGVEKARLNDKSIAQPTAGWRTTIISTGEISLLSNSKGNTGIRVRLLEIGNRPWTTSAEHADHLKAGLRANCGHAGPEFIGHLMTLTPETLAKRWAEWRDKLVMRMSAKNQFASRVAGKLGLIVLAAELANDALDLTLNVDGIVNTLLEIEQEAGGLRDVSERAYEHFMGMVNQHAKKFSSDAPVVWGRFVETNDRISQVQILPSAFKEVMKEGGFDSELVLRMWKNAGRLDSDSDKTTRKKVITSGNRVAVHCIRIEADVNDEEQVMPASTGHTKPGRRRRVTPPHPSVVPLFRD